MSVLVFLLLRQLDGSLWPLLLCWRFCSCDADLAASGDTKKIAAAAISANVVSGIVGLGISLRPFICEHRIIHDWQHHYVFI